MGRQMQVKIRHCRRKMRYKSKTVQDTRTVSIKSNRKSYALSNGDVSDDLG